MRLPSELPTFWRRLVGICAVAALARLLFALLAAKNQVGAGDFNFYNQTADLIADGRGYINPFDLLFQGKAHATALHPPAWPFLLSLVSAVGGEGHGIARTTFTDHRMVGVVLGPVAVLLMGLVGRRVGGDRVGLTAGALTALYPGFVAMDTSIMSETLFGPLAAGLLLSAYWVYDKPSWKSALVFGLVLALAALTRTETLLLLVLLGPLLVWHAGRGRRLLVGGVMVAATVVALAPWTLRNLSAFDSLTLTTNDGGTLLGANCPLTYDRGGRDYGYWELKCVPPRHDLDEAQQSTFYRDRAIDYARAHAGDLPGVMAVRFARVWGFYQPFRYTAEAQPPWAAKLAQVCYFGLLLLAGAGLVLMLRRRQRPVWILLAPIVLVAIVGVFVYGLPRFRYGAEFSFVVLASVALVGLAERAAVRRRTRTASSANAAATQATAPTAT